MAEQFRSVAAAAMLIRHFATPSRYAQVGLICALLNNAIVIGLDLIGCGYIVSLVAAFVLVTAIGYLMHAEYTFRVRLTAAGLYRFYGASATGFIVSAALMVILCSGLGLRAMIAMPIATVLLFIWNFLLASWALASRSDPVLPFQ